MKYVKLRLLLIRYHKEILYSHWRIKGLKIFSLPLSLLPSKTQHEPQPWNVLWWRLFKRFKMSSAFCILMALLKGTQYSWIWSLECLMLNPGRIHKNFKYFEATGHKEWLDTVTSCLGLWIVEEMRPRKAHPLFFCSLNFGTWLGYDYRIRR